MHRLLSLVVLVLFTHAAFSQQPDDSQAKLLAPCVPGSPTTAALERYVSMPVSEHTGTPQITIPLLDIKGRQLSLPIRLSYHAAGVRVTDDASWVGLGWSLQAGGQISRAVRNQPDEQSTTGYLANCTTVRQASTINDHIDFTTLKAVAENRLDYEPDLFSYSFPGGSGQFQFDNTGRAQAIPFAPIAITAALVGPDSQIEILSPTGDRYQFADWEKTTVRRRGPDDTYRSAWYLSRIISADATDTIYFDYSRHHLSYAPTETQQQSLSNFTWRAPGVPTFVPVAQVIPDISFVETQAVKLARIRFATGYVQFNADTVSRQDIPSDSRLRSVELYTRATRQAPAQLLRRFTFDQSYFTSTGGKQARCNYRLRLDAVTESNGPQSKPPHRFDYVSTVALPPRDSYAQDHWGYYNGRNNLDLVPRRVFSTLYGPRVVGSANREPDSTFVQAGLLQRITYPTGGTTTFHFEANVVNEPQPIQQPQHEVYVTAEQTPDRDPVNYTTRFQIPPDGDVIGEYIMFIECANGSSSWPHNTGGASITDVTGGNAVPKVLYSIGGCEATTVDPITGFGDTLLLKAGHTYQLNARSDNPQMRAQVRVKWTEATPSFVIFPQAPIPTFHAYKAEKVATKDSTERAFTRFQVTSLVNVKAQIRQTVSYRPHDDPPKTWIKNAGLVSISDMTPGFIGQQPVPVVRNGYPAPVTTPQVTLLAGHTYQLNATSDNPDMETSIEVEWQDPEQPVSTPQPVLYANKNIVTGGVRIRRMLTTSAPTSPVLLKRYAYGLATDPARSSGYRVGPSIQYAQKRVMQYGVFFDGATDYQGPAECTLHLDAGWEATVLSSPLGQGGGESTAYSTVSVDEGGLNGRTVSFYATCPDSVSTAFPLLPSLDNSWRRGLLLAQNVYRSGSQAHEQLLQRTVHTYAIDARNRTAIVGFKAMPRVASQGSGCGNNEGNRAYTAAHFAYANSRQRVLWQYLSRSVVRRYDPQDTLRVHTTTTRYQYDNAAHAQVSTVKVSQSGGQDTAITRYRYPLDYPLTGTLAGAARPLQRLVAQHVLTPVIEQQQWRQQGTSAKLVQGTLTHYTGLRPYQAWQVKTAAPLATFTTSTVTAGTLRQDASYQRKATLERFDAWGNVLQYLAEKAPVQSYLWGAKGTALLAQAQAASYLQIAATSFEPDSPGRWQYDDAASRFQATGRTGSWSYRLDGSHPVRVDSLPAGGYQLRFWATSLPQVTTSSGGAVTVTPLGGPVGSTGWQQYQGVPTVSGAFSSLTIQTTGSLWLDEVRLYPIGAQVTTYTSAPLVGTTSQTGPDGRIVFYEYDTFGRLERVRDEQGRILTQQQYHYALQP